MKILLVALPLLAAGLAFGPSPARPPQDPPKPGPEHALQQRLAGNWDAVVFTTDEKGVEQKSKGTMTRTKRGAFHVDEEFRGEFQGMPFTGHGMHGYCPVKKQYFTFWVDSMVPSPLTLYGSFDEKKKELTMHGECVGMSGAFEKCRTVTLIPDDDHMSWAMYGAGPDGKEMRQLRIEYTRRK